MSNVLILPGSRWQEPLLHKAREMGHRALVVSPEQDPACRKNADGFLRSDIFDVERIVNFCRMQNVEAVVSDECDIAMPVVAELGETLGLCTMSRETAKLYTDKFLMREFCKEHNLKCPEYRRCQNVDDAVALLKELERPIVIKPLDSNASHGVFTVHDEEGVRRHFGEAMSYSRREKVVLAERYIKGTEFTIDGIKTPERHFTLAVSEKKHFRHNANIANELFFTHRNERFDYDELRRTNDRFVLESGLGYGFTHAEYKCEGGEYYLIEIGARGGGNEISSLITQHMSGYDTYRYLVDCALGKSYEKDFSIRSEYMDRAAVLYFFQTPHGGGKVKAIHGEGFLKSTQGILDYALHFKVGDLIGDALNDSARIGFYIAGKENRNELDILMSEIERKFYIEVE